MVEVFSAILHKALSAGAPKLTEEEKKSESGAKDAATRNLRRILSVYEDDNEMFQCLDSEDEEVA